MSETSVQQRIPLWRMFHCTGFFLRLWLKGGEANASTSKFRESLQIKSQDQSDLDRRKIYRREIGRKARQKGHREYAGLQCQDIRLSVSPVQAGGIHVHRRQIIQRGEIVPHLSVVASQKFVSSGRHINIERLPLGSLTVQEVVHRLLGR